MVELERHTELRNEALIEAAERVTIPEVLVLVQLGDEALTEAVWVDKVGVLTIQALVVALEERLNEEEARLRSVEIDVVVDTAEVLELIVIVCHPVVVWRHWAVSGSFGRDAAYER